MSKQEYEQLLQSDYWKGFSYSLIKERNFTCEDCGAQYPNERNKLQVHHLVYRDINPWSYKPEEMVVLCVECHQKRHGIMPKQEETTPSGIYTSDTGGYTKSYKTTKEEPVDVESSAYERFQEGGNIKPMFSSVDGLFSNIQANKRIRWIFLFVVLIMPFLIGVLFVNKSSDSIIQDEVIELNTPDNEENVSKGNSSPNGKRNDRTEKKESEKDDFEAVDEFLLPIIEEEPELVEHVTDAPVKSEPGMTQKKMEKSISEILDEKIHAQTVQQAKRYGVSTEGTTSEIQDRIIRKQLEN